MKIFVLQHVHSLSEDNEDVKFIGVYSTRDKAQGAVSRLTALPGFREHGDGFSISDYELDVEHWTEGFVTVS